MRQRARTGFSAFIVGFAAMVAAAPAHAASRVAVVSAKVVKPLTLTHVQDLDLGTIVLGPGIWSNATVGISHTGTFTCANANVTCSGAVQVAKYNVTGSSQQTARITAPDVTLVNQSDATNTLTLIVDSPGTVFIPNAGNPGVDFSLGGSISLSSSTVGGTYSGTFNVTVDYQ